MITVKDLQEKLKEFPEDVDILITGLEFANRYYKLKTVGIIYEQDPLDDSKSICPVLVF